jgi:hypothetical protein
MDLDLANNNQIKQKLEAVASALLANRPGSVNNLGSFYLYRFEQFREVKDIDFAKNCPFPWAQIQCY